MMRFPELRPRQPLVGIALAGALGIALADRWAVDWWVAMPVLLLCAAVLALRPYIVLCWLIAALSFASLHTLHHHQSGGRRFSKHLEAGPRTVVATGIVWSEPEEVKTWARTPGSRFKLKLETVQLDGVSRGYDTTVNVRWSGAMPSYGDRVELRGAASIIPAPRNPGQFNYQVYSQRQGIYSEVVARYPTDCKVTGQGHGNPLYAFAISARRWMQAQLALDLEDEPTVVDLVASMVLGLRGETPEEVQDLFRTTGTLHLFAVSGFNVALLAAITWFLLKPLRFSRRTSVFLTIPIILTYALITGLSASCVRAAIMASVMLMGLLFDRPSSVFNSLAAAALLIFAVDTNQLFMPGFQFSFVLVVAIALLSAPLQKKMEPLGRPDDFVPRALWNWRQRLLSGCWNSIAAALAVTLAAWLGSFAFTAGYFHLFSPVSILANLFAGLLASMILSLGLLAVLTAPISTSLAVLFNNANWICAKSLLFVVQVFAHLPGGHLYVELPRDFSTAPAVEFTVFDLGQGGAIHLRSGPEDWLIDCGHRFEYERIVLPYLRSRGVNDLDALVLTHGDAQHIGAAQDAWSALRPVALFDSALKDRSQTRRTLHKLFAEQSRGKRILQRGDIAETSGRVQLEVLYPPVGLSRSVADDKALVLRLTSGGIRVLLMSDSGFATERWLSENEPDLSADILVKGWHSKDLSGTSDFLSRVRPQVIIAGATQTPATTEALVKWAAGRAALFLQQETGAVRLIVEQDGTFKVKGTLGEHAFRGSSSTTKPPEAPSGSGAPGESADPDP